MTVTYIYFVYSICLIMSILRALLRYKAVQTLQALEFENGFSAPAVAPAGSLPLASEGEQAPHEILPVSTS
jgi:hypothetical protein